MRSPFVLKPFEVRGMGGGQALLCIAGQQTLALPLPVAMALRSIGPVFTSWEECALSIVNALKLPPSELEPILQWVKRLSEHGAFLHQADAEQICRKPGYAKGAPIRTLTVATKERPESLERSLASYLENAQRYGRELTLLVADDASTPEQRSRCRAAVQRLQSRFSFPSSYASIEHRARYAERLARAADVPPEVVQFALLDPFKIGSTCGANSNGLLLAAAGECFLKVDDDSFCEPAVSESFREQCTLTTGFAGFARVFAESHEIDSVVQRQDVDFIGAHERYLGKAFSDCCEKWNIDLQETQSAFLLSLNEQTPRIGATVGGLYGDSGSGSPTYYLMLSELPAIQRLVQDEAYYRQALVARQTWKATHTVTVAEAPACQMTNLGIDARGLVPPFMPVLRGSDILFGETLQHAIPGAFLAKLPWAIRHTPTKTRQDPADAVWKTQESILFQILMSACIACFRTAAAVSREPAKLTDLGAFLMRISRFSSTDFQKLVRPALASRACAILQMIDRNIARVAKNAPYFAADAEKTRHAFLTSLCRPDYWVPRDVPRNSDSPSAAALTLRLIGEYGRLLVHWPQMLAAAEELKAGGVGPFEAC